MEKKKRVENVRIHLDIERGCTYNPYFNKDSPKAPGSVISRTEQFLKRKDEHLQKLSSQMNGDFTPNCDQSRRTPKKDAFKDSDGARLHEYKQTLDERKELRLLE